MREPASLAQSYLRAVYARDFSTAYGYVSSDDQRARNLTQYLRQRAPFNGFALEAAKLLASMIEVEVVSNQVAASRILLTVRYNAPDPERISELLRGWNAYRLNSLPLGQRREIIETIHKQKRDQALVMISGEEKLTLVRQGDEWRVFLDWARGVTIPFRAILTEAGGAANLDVSLSRKQATIQPGDVFEVDLKIKNRTQNVMVISIGHLVHPRELTDYLQIVQCGFLLPIKLEPGKEQEYSGTYLLRGSLPDGVRQLNLDYDFRQIRAP
jgi:hypothetical protein